MLAGADPVMAANGTVTGTANSLSLAMGQAHAARFIAPALAAIDAAVVAGLDADAGDDQKAAIVAAWNDEQAPWLQDLAEAIISHITTYAEVDVTSELTIQSTDGGLQRLPDSPFDETIGPLTNVTLPVTTAGTSIA